jgi:hypothetical protein
MRSPLISSVQYFFCDCEFRQSTLIEVKKVQALIKVEMAGIANGNNSDTDFLHESSASEDNQGGFLEVSCLGNL